MGRKFFGGKKKNPNMNTKSIFFYSYKLNKDKFDIISDYAQLIQDTKNYLSIYVKENLILEIFNNNLDLKSFMEITKPYNTHDIGSSFYQRVQREVYTRYKTQLNNIEYKHKFLKNTEFSTTVQYLVKAYRGDIKTIINHLSQGNKPHHKKVLKIINKFGDRLWNVVFSIQNRLLNRFKTVIFKTLCFDGINQLTVNHKLNFIEFDPNIKIANTIINLNIPNSRSITDRKTNVIAIPTLFNKDYHKNLNYTQSLSGPNQCQTQTSYQCKIVNNRVKITITREEIKHSFSIVDEKILGVDTNTGRDLFSLSDEHLILYDDWIIEKFKRLQKHITKKQHNKDLEEMNLIIKNIKDTKKHKDIDLNELNTRLNDKLKINREYSKNTTLRVEKMNRRSIYYNNLKARELIDYCILHGYNHIVMEDLNLQCCKGRWSKKYGINYNDIAKILHLNDFKNTIKRIGNKFGIAVSFTNPEYTSQTCSECGHIEKANRVQEMFSCKQCGCTLDAGYNAALIIRNRILIPYLRDALHNIETELCLHYVGKKYVSKNTYVNTYNTLHGNTLPNSVYNSKKNKVKKVKVQKNAII